MCGKIKVVNRNRKNGEGDRTVRYKCPKCGVEEEIPKSVVEMFDIMDDGDVSVPPMFKCQKCDGDMQPIKYKGVHGITYEIDKR